jgi:hypothetical protein
MGGRTGGSKSSPGAIASACSCPVVGGVWSTSGISTGLKKSSPYCSYQVCHLFAISFNYSSDDVLAAAVPGEIVSHKMRPRWLSAHRCRPMQTIPRYCRGTDCFGKARLQTLEVSTSFVILDTINLVPRKCVEYTSSCM